MRRIEIIANKSVEADLLDALTRKGVAGYHTRIPEVYGVGNSGPRQGDHVWPEANVVLVVYCSEEEAAQIRDAVRELKRFFKDEGITVFECAAERLA